MNKQFGDARFNTGEFFKASTFLFYSPSKHYVTQIISDFLSFLTFVTNHECFVGLHVLRSIDDCNFR